MIEQIHSMINNNKACTSQQSLKKTLHITNYLDKLARTKLKRSKRMETKKRDIKLIPSSRLSAYCGINQKRPESKFFRVLSTDGLVTV